MITKNLNEYLRKTESITQPLQTIGRLTIAQSIRRSSNPYRAAVTSFSRREIIRSDDGGNDKKIFHFEDGSFLTFDVTYTAIEDGSE